MSEQDLAAKVVEWLSIQRWDIYQEVEMPYSKRVADIIAVRLGICMAVEVKTSLTFTVIEQALRHNIYTHYQCIAVPAISRDRPGRWLAEQLCNTKRIGVIQVGISSCDYTVAPQIDRNTIHYKKQLIESLREEHKHFAQAGSNNGGHWTPYKHTMNEVKSIIETHGPCGIAVIMQHLTEHHYSGDNAAKGSIANALVMFENDWCQTEYIKNKRVFSIKQEMP